MKKNTIFKIFSLLVISFALILFVFSYNISPKFPNCNLIYTDGSKIQAYDRNTGLKELVFEDSGFKPLYISEGPTKSVFIYGGKSFYSEEIFEYNLETGSLAKVHNGKYPLFLKSYNALFFFEKNNKGLYDLKKMIYGQDAKAVKLTSDLINGSLKPILKISEKEVLFFDKYYKIHIFNLEDESDRILGLRGCIPVMFRSHSAELFCRNKNNSSEIYSADIETLSKRENLLGLEKVGQLSYFPVNDMALANYPGNPPAIYPYLHSIDFSKKRIYPFKGLGFRSGVCF